MSAFYHMVTDVTPGIAKAKQNKTSLVSSLFFFFATIKKRVTSEKENDQIKVARKPSETTSLINKTNINTKKQQFCSLQITIVGWRNKIPQSVK